MHKQKVLHRDLKGPNVLIDRHGCLKIGDWGLARNWNEKRSEYTTPVITLWYRPPELLLGHQTRVTKYDSAVDIWSAGCIFGELITKHALLPGKNEAEQLEKIWDLLGSPKEQAGAPGCAENPDYQFDVWPTVGSYPHWKDMSCRDNPKPRRLQEKFGGQAHKLASTSGRPVNPKDDNVLMVDLLEKLLALDPKKRITAKEGLDHDYFYYSNGVLAPSAKPEKLPKFSVSSVHELDARNRAKEQKEKRHQKEAETAARRAQQASQATQNQTGLPPGWVQT